MRPRSQCSSWVMLTAGLTISGCYSSGTYVMDRSAFEEAVADTPDVRRRTAIPARSSTAGKQVWLRGESLEHATVLAASDRWVQLEAKVPEYASPAGAVLLAVGVPLVARGSMLLANNRADGAAWALGADGPGALLGVGIVGVLSGAALLILGRTIPWQEVKPRKPGWSYLQAPAPASAPAPGL